MGGYVCEEGWNKGQFRDELQTGGQDCTYADRRSCRRIEDAKGKGLDDRKKIRSCEERKNGVSTWKRAVETKVYRDSPIRPTIPSSPELAFVSTAVSSRATD